MNVITCTSTFALNFDTCSWSGCGDGGGGGGRQVGDVPPQIINAQTATGHAKTNLTFYRDDVAVAMTTQIIEHSNYIPRTTFFDLLARPYQGRI